MALRFQTPFARERDYLGFEVRGEEYPRFPIVPESDAGGERQSRRHPDRCFSRHGVALAHYAEKLAPDTILCVTEAISAFWFIRNYAARQLRVSRSKIDLVRWGTRIRRGRLRTLRRISRAT